MKKIAVLFISLCSVFILSFSVGAANNVTNMYIDVTLNEDGSADIHQQWTGYFNEGTENYYPFMTKDRLEIINFTVKDEERVYETLDEWDVDASFSKKAGKCGLNSISDGYEVCWGISDYGSNTYEIDYTVKNMVGGYDDSDGFNFRFVNSEMNTVPTSVSVTIKLWNGTPITDEICNIWGFGYDGEIQFRDGTVQAWTRYPLDYENHVTLMLEFSKGIFTPEWQESGSFEQVKQRAFDGSDYDTSGDDKEFLIMLCICVGIPLLGVIVYLIYKLVQKTKVKSIKKKAEYHREAPLDELNPAYTLLKATGECDESAIIGARILKLIMLGCIEPIDTCDSANSFFAKYKVSFRLVRGFDDKLDPIDKALYKLLDISAGSDGILDPGEMKEHCFKNPYRLRRIIERCYDGGEKILNAKKCSLNGSYTNIFKYTDAGIAELSKLFGLEKYLLDFSLISERELSDTFIWQDYMVYACLFGIADKVAEQLKAVYPQRIPEIEIYERNIIFANTYRRHMYSSMVQSERKAQAARSAGSGGRVSFGGGGGFSGGGVGGGSR